MNDNKEHQPEKNFNSVDHSHEGKSTIAVEQSANRRRPTGNRTRRPRASQQQTKKNPVSQFDDD